MAFLQFIPTSSKLAGLILFLAAGAYSTNSFATTSFGDLKLMTEMSGEVNSETAEIIGKYELDLVRDIKTHQTPTYQVLASRTFRAKKGKSRREYDGSYIPFSQSYVKQICYLNFDQDYLGISGASINGSGPFEFSNGVVTGNETLVLIDRTKNKASEIAFSDINRERAEIIAAQAVSNENSVCLEHFVLKKEKTARPEKEWIAILVGARPNLVRARRKNFALMDCISSVFSTEKEGGHVCSLKHYKTIDDLRIKDANSREHSNITYFEGQKLKVVKQRCANNLRQTSTQQMEYCKFFFPTLEVARPSVPPLGSPHPIKR